MAPGPGFPFGRPGPLAPAAKCRRPPATPGIPLPPGPRRAWEAGPSGPCSAVKRGPVAPEGAPKGRRNRPNAQGRLWGRSPFQNKGGDQKSLVSQAFFAFLPQVAASAALRKSILLVNRFIPIEDGRLMDLAEEKLLAADGQQKRAVAVNDALIRNGRFIRCTVA